MAAGKVEVLAGGEGADIASILLRSLIMARRLARWRCWLVNTHPEPVRAVENNDFLKISKPDFERLITSNYQLAEGIERISHARAISNLATSKGNPGIWAKVANQSLYRVSRHEANKLLAETGKGAGMAIAFGIVSLYLFRAVW